MAKRKVTQEVPQPSTADETYPPLGSELTVQAAVAPEPVPPAEPKVVVVDPTGLKIETY